jgi:hypothetical protein
VLRASKPVTRIRFGFRGKNQLPLFMLWREYLDETGEVFYAAVIFEVVGSMAIRRSAVRSVKEN